MFTVKELVIAGGHGKPINADVCYLANGKAKPIVIFSHGFQGFKDWGHFNLMANEFAQQGFFFLKFNFAYNGTTAESPTAFVDLEAFGNNNLSKELDDLGCVMDYLSQPNEFSSEIDTDRLYLLGHSRGGGITILKTATDPRVKKAVTLASVGEFGYFWTEDILADWKETGVIYRENTRTNQQMPLYYQYYEDYTAHPEKFDLLKAISQITVPLLAIHGTKDGVIPYSKAERFKEYNPAVKVIPIEGGDHTLGGRHPYLVEKLPDAAQEAVNLAIEFFK